MNYCPKHGRRLVPHPKSKDLIVFLHGLSGHPQDTWKEFPELIRTCSALSGRFELRLHKYPTGLISFFKRSVTISQLADELATSLRVDFNPKDKYQQIILVCHSLGGLVARQYIVNLAKNNKSIDNYRVVFFATPHDGSSLANIGSKLPFTSRQLKQLCKNSEFLDTLNKDWIHLNIEDKIDSHYIAGSEDNIVNEKSAKPHWTKDNHDVVHQDHKNIVKPDSHSSKSFLVLKKFLLSRQLSRGPEEENKQTLLVNPSRHRNVHNFSKIIKSGLSSVAVMAIVSTFVFFVAQKTKNTPSNSPPATFSPYPYQEEIYLNLPNSINLSLVIKEYKVTSFSIWSNEEMATTTTIKYVRDYPINESKKIVQFNPTGHQRIDFFYLAEINSIKSGKIDIEAHLENNDYWKSRLNNIEIVVTIKGKIVVEHSITNPTDENWSLYMDPNTQITSEGKKRIVRSNVYPNAIWEFPCPDTDGEHQLVGELSIM